MVLTVSKSAAQDIVVCASTGTPGSFLLWLDCGSQFQGEIKEATCRFHHTEPGVLNCDLICNVGVDLAPGQRWCLWGVSPRVALPAHLPTSLLNGKGSEGRAHTSGGAGPPHELPPLEGGVCMEVLGLSLGEVSVSSPTDLVAEASIYTGRSPEILILPLGLCSSAAFFCCSSCSRSFMGPRVALAPSPCGLLFIILSTPLVSWLHWF